MLWERDALSPVMVASPFRVKRIDRDDRLLTVKQQAQAHNRASENGESDAAPSVFRANPLPGLQVTRAGSREVSPDEGVGEGTTPGGRKTRPTERVEKITVGPALPEPFIKAAHHQTGGETDRRVIDDDARPAPGIIGAGSSALAQQQTPRFVDAMRDADGVHALRPQTGNENAFWIMNAVVHRKTGRPKRQ